MPLAKDQKRKPYGHKYKKNTDKYFKGKEGKVDDIKRALTHRARLRKSYFKLLEKEGEVVPEKQTTHHKHSEKERHNKQQPDNDDGAAKYKDNDNDRNNTPPKRKPLTFQERIEIKKERKQRQTQEKIERTANRLKEIKEKAKIRQEKTKRLRDARTSRGQPLMGPRINDLLDKIRQDK